MRVVWYHLSKWLARVLVAPWVRVRVLRPELARRRGAWILAANHISHFDPPLIGTRAMRKIDWMGMVELFSHPAAAAWLRAVDAFPVDRARLDRAAIRTALLRLRAGHAVGLFPEGGIRDGKGSILNGAPMRPGVAGLAQATGSPIVPCVILGSDRCYNLPWLWRPWRRVPVWIGFAPAVEPAGEREEIERRLALALRELAAEMRTRFALGEHDLPKPPAQRRRERDLAAGMSTR